VKIAIVNNMAPFVWGGAEELAANLKLNLEKEGHEAELLRIPFSWEPADVIPSQMLLVDSLEMAGVDKVIALKFPAYLIRHHNKTVWLLHQYRQAYDLLETGMSNLNGTPAGQAIQKLISSADETLRSANGLFCNSPVTQKRLLTYSAIRSEVLRPPINDPELFIGGSSEPYIFAGGRINSMKRQHLLLEALAFRKSDMRLIIAGPPDRNDDANLLTELVNRYQLQDQVTLDFGFHSRTKYADLVNRCTAVAYLPVDEDSLGYVAMEAAQAQKPVISCLDSGGLLDLVVNESTGWVVDPKPQQMFGAFESALAPSGKSQEYGQKAKVRLSELVPTWQEAIERLLA
jgi:glycosyltransferase involved in cell wall biosynthesis